jgi:hypothetical protein
MMPFSTPIGEQYIIVKLYEMLYFYCYCTSGDTSISTGNYDFQNHNTL